MAKYFLHIDPDEKEFFQKTTKLLYIDDEDSDMMLYYFEDGTKCNVDYIAPMSDSAPNVKTHRMVEISAPNATWKFKKRNVVMENVQGMDKDGIKHNIANPYFMDRNGAPNTKLSADNETGLGTGFVKEGVRYDIIAPRKSVVPVEDANPYYVSYIKYATSNNIELPKDVYTAHVTGKMPEPIVTNKASLPKKNLTTKFNFPTGKSKPVIVLEVDNTIIEEPIEVECNQDDILQTNSTSINNAPIINKVSDELIINTDVIKDFTVQDKDQVYKISVNTLLAFINNRNQPKCSDKEYKVSNDIDIDIINTPEGDLVNNMINMSQKDICDIDMTISLSLPPVDVYSLIKKVYSSEMADGFVKTIANRMPVKELRYALADGLLAYYDGDFKNEVIKGEIYTESPLFEPELVKDDNEV